MKILLVTINLLVLSACSSIPVSVDYDKQVNFSRLARYAWAQDTLPRSGNVIIDSDTLLHDRIHKQLDQWLLTHGYIKTPADKADFLVRYNTLIKNKTGQLISYPYTGYYSGFWPYYGYNSYYLSGYACAIPPQVTTYDYQQLTLVIDFLNPDNKKIIWRGMVSNNINNLRTLKDKDQLIIRDIDSILSHFPPDKEKDY